MKSRELSKQSQIAGFRKAARELGCDESEERFQDTLRELTKHKPKDASAAPKRKDT
jgi:hypothetical protein